MDWNALLVGSILIWYVKNLMTMMMTVMAMATTKTKSGGRRRLWRQQLLSQLMMGVGRIVLEYVQEDHLVLVEHQELLQLYAVTM
jgi:hypothetical protein